MFYENRTLTITWQDCIDIVIDLCAFKLLTLNAKNTGACWKMFLYHSYLFYKRCLCFNISLVWNLQLQYYIITRIFLHLWNNNSFCRSILSNNDTSKLRLGTPKRKITNHFSIKSQDTLKWKNDNVMFDLWCEQSNYVLHFSGCHHPLCMCLTKQL